MIFLKERETYGICLDRNGTSLSVLNEPCPSTALDAGKSGVELLLQSVQAAVVAVDGLGKRSSRSLSTTLGLGSEVLPEESVVDVST